MLDVLSITAPIFIVIAIGFLSTRFGVTSVSGARAIGEFVLRFALPALIFKSLSQTPFLAILNLPYLAVYALSSAIVFAAIFSLARYFGKGDLAAAAIQGLGASASNSGFVGYPTALLFVGSAASIGLALSMAVENILIIPLALSLAEIGRHGERSLFAVFGHIVGRLIRNPLIIAIVLGVLASLVGLKLPAPFSRVIDMFAAASGAAALFAVGGGLFGLEPTGVISDVARIVVGKLIGHPLVVWAALQFAPSIDPALRRAMLIFASAPMLGVYPLLARQFGEEKVGGAALLVATAASFVTMSLLLMAL